jgi:hypothetical protein
MRTVLPSSGSNASMLRVSVLYSRKSDIRGR